MVPAGGAAVLRFLAPHTFCPNSNAREAGRLIFVSEGLATTAAEGAASTLHIGEISEVSSPEPSINLHALSCLSMSNPEGTHRSPPGGGGGGVMGG